MSITVHNLYIAARKEFHTKLLTNENGLDNLVRWFHIVEDISVIDFLRPQEIVLFVGNKLEGITLLDFVKALTMQQVSAVIIGIGPYIPKVPQEVIEFAQEHDLPIMTHEWKVKMSEVTELFAKMIIANREDENNVTMAMKDIIFQTNKAEESAVFLESVGFGKDLDYRVIIMGNPNIVESSLNDSWMHFSTLLEHKCQTFAVGHSVFLYKNQIIMVLHMGSNPIEKAVEGFTSIVNQYLGHNVKIAVSRQRRGLSSISGSFDTALEIWHLCCNKDANVLYEKELGIYKLLFSIEDKSALREFYRETLESLQHVSEKKIDYVQLLYEYMQTDGNLNKMAENHYIHRNTVQYHIRKIEKITGLDLDKNEDKLKVMLCMFIRDIL